MDGTHNENNHEKIISISMLLNLDMEHWGESTTKNGKQNGSTSSGVLGFMCFVSFCHMHEMELTLELLSLFW